MKIKQIWRYYGNFIFFCAAFYFFEMMLRLSTPRQFDFVGFAFSVLFNCIMALFICSILSFVPRKAHVIASNIVLSLVAAIYISQIIYFNVFGTFYNTESMFNAGQILEFWSTALRSTWERLLYILLCVSMIPVYNLFVRNSVLASAQKDSKPPQPKDSRWFSPIRQITLALFATIYITMVVAFVPFATDPFTPYSMFFGQHNYEESIKRTGLLSTFHIDVLRTFIPKNATGAFQTLDDLRSSPPEIPETQPEAPPPPDVPEVDDVTYISYDNANDVYYEPDEQYEEPEPIEFGYNVMDIDFQHLIDNAPNDTVRTLHEYFANSQPSQKNEFTGMFEGYNLIMFVAEAFSPFAVREDITPTLYHMVHGGFYFSNFYTPCWGVSTSDGEYVALTGLLPRPGVWSFYRSHNNYLPFVMGNQLSNLGYTTFAYHNHTHTFYRRHLSHPNMGYVFKGVGGGLELPNIVWPNSDLEMIQVTIDDFINRQPFHAYYMTVSGHLEYNFMGNAMAVRNRDAVEHLAYSYPLRAYLATQIELDRALEYLMRRLNEAGIAENTVIVLSSDHRPYGLDSVDGISEFLGRPVDRNFEIYSNYLIIYSQGMEPMVIDRPASSLDIIPTISNLFGLEFDSRLLMGRDIFSDSDPLVIFLNRSFITENGRRVRGGEFIPNPGVTVPYGYVDYISAVIEAKFAASTNILNLDYYRIVFGGDESQ